MSYNKETGMYEGYIYCITNKVNNKKYVGQTTETVHKRWIRHINAHSNMAISKAIDKYGKENFEIKELLCASCDTKKELCDTLNYLEIVFIQHHNSLINYGNGYNITRGGSNIYLIAKQFDLYDINGNFIKSFETAQEAALHIGCSDTSVYLISSGKQSNYKNKYVFRYKGLPFNQYEVNASPKIYRFDLKGNITKIYNTKNEAMIDVRNTYGSCMDLSNVIDNPNLLAGGFWWSFSPHFNYKGKSTDKKVCQYSKQGKLINTFSSLSICAEELSLKLSNIQKVCKGERHTCGGYVFRYENDDFSKYEVDIDINSMYNQKRVNQYTKDGIYIKTFNSIQQATMSLTSKSSNAISMCCHHAKHYNSAFGYKWYLEDDITQPDKSKIVYKEKNGKVYNSK